MRVEARAKINWTLDITGQREDGYHLMDMLMQPVTLSDTVTLERADNLSLTTSGRPLIPADEKNLAYRAAMALKAATGYPGGAAIHVEKRIPAGAGMGGGSADAAAVLWGLNRLWGVNLPQGMLERVGLTLGADVPFCLRGGLTRTTGIGETMEVLRCKKEYELIVVQPRKALSTASIFQAYHRHAHIVHPDNDAAQEALVKGDILLLSRSLGNVLQPASEEMCPAIHEAIYELKSNGAFAAFMTGSGSAVIGAFKDATKASSAYQKIRRRWVRVWRCCTCQESLVML